MLDFIDKSFKVTLKEVQAIRNDIKEMKEFNKYNPRGIKYALDKGYFTDEEIYSKQITKSTYVFIQRIANQWEGYRVTYGVDNQLLGQKDIFKSKDFIKVVDKMENYIKYYLKGS